MTFYNTPITNNVKPTDITQNTNAIAVTPSFINFIHIKKRKTTKIAKV